MRSDLTDITLVVDRSGSMEAIREDAEGGVNSFIREQAKEPGEALLTLVQFDTEYEFLHKGIPIGQAPAYKLVPRSMTALLDAVGRAVNETGERLAKMDEKDRPGLVVFVIVTDGHENSSQEFTKDQVKKLIEKQQTKYDWQFTFLGADQNAFDDAGAMGIQRASAAYYTKDKVAAAFSASGDNVARMRKQRQADQTVCNEFTPEERDAMT